MIFLFRKAVFPSKNQAKSGGLKSGVKQRLFCLKDSFWNDRKNDSHSDMTRGKSPLLPKRGSRASHRREAVMSEGAPIIPKGECANHSETRAFCHSEKRDKSKTNLREI